MLKKLSDESYTPTIVDKAKLINESFKECVKSLDKNTDEKEIIV